MLSTLVFALVITSVLGVVGYSYWRRTQAESSVNDLILAEASKGPFDHIVLEQGELESTSNVDVVCNVRARVGSQGTAILWVIDEGTVVKPDEKLVELDSSALNTALKEQRIVVISSEAAVAAAGALVLQAKITRQEYLEGLFQTEESLIQSEIAIAEQGMRKALLALASTQRLVAKGLVKSLQLEADQFSVANNRALLEGAESRLKVLQNLTRQKMLVQFDSAIDSAEAQLAAANSSLEEELNELHDLQKQIDLCVITAPAEGVVIHANQYSGRGGTAEFVVQPGAIIRERQTIIRLPDPKKMQVRAKINESHITLIEAGLPAKIRVDAISDVELVGRVSKVNRYSEPSSWMSSSIKEYAAFVEIVDPPEIIRTGMTAEVQIFVEQLPDAIQVPIQAIYEHGGKTYSLVKTGPNSFATHSVKIGATNDKFATITEGIDVGDSVVLNLRQNLALMDLPKLVREDNTAVASLSTAVEVGDGPSKQGPHSKNGLQSDQREGRVRDARGDESAGSQRPPGPAGPRGPGGPPGSGRPEGRPDGGPGAEGGTPRGQGRRNEADRADASTTKSEPALAASLSTTVAENVF